jgi:DNA-directed RNA polymerase sigma subunit (sigma70/sigma32)
LKIFEKIENQGETAEDQLSVEAHKTKSLRQLGNEYGVSHEAVRRIPRRIGMFDLI